MRMRPGRRLVRTAAVGGAAYMVGSHAATKSAEQQQHEAEQSAQIADLQQQQAAMAQPQYAPPPPPQYAPPPQQYAPQYAPPPPPQQYAPPPQYAPEPSAAAPEPSAAAPARDPMDMLKQLGELKAAGVITDAEFEAKKAQLLSQI